MRDIARLIYTHNPFYLLSACCVLYGLRIAFQGQSGQEVNAWILAGALSGYTLLLAVAAWAVVRFGKVWDDARTIALLVVLLLVAISTSFDEFCITMPQVASNVLIFALAFAVVITEGLTRALGVRFPMRYRGPYYLLLSIFFIYPLLIDHPIWNSSGLSLSTRMQVLCFPMIMGLATLTLLPAVRRGSAGMKENGTPWPWPFFPWSIFVFLGVGIVGRSYFLTVSFQQDPGLQTTFGAYYLLPFAFAVLVLLGELALNTRSETLKQFVFIGPVLMGLLALPVRNERVFREFLDEYVNHVGAPLWVATLAACCLYAYWWMRGLKIAEWGLAASLVASTMVSPTTLGPSELSVIQWWPIAVMGLIQIRFLFWNRSSFRFLVGCVMLVIAAWIGLRHTDFAANHGAIPVHLILLATIIAAYAFSDVFAQLLKPLTSIAIIVLMIAALGAGGLNAIPASIMSCYVAALTAFACLMWLACRSALWEVTLFAGFALSTWPICSLLLNEGSHVIPERAMKVLLIGAFCFVAGALISAAKAGLADPLLRSMRRRWRAIVLELHGRST